MWGKYHIAYVWNLKNNVTNELISNSECLLKTQHCFMWEKSRMIHIFDVRKWNNEVVITKNEQYWG